MALSETDRSYFLGDVSAEEATRIELAVMEDAAFAERMEAAEAELIDAYVEGALTAAERQRFETVFIAVPGRADRVRLAAELSRRATRLSGAAPAASTRPSLPLRILLPMAAALLLGIGLWFATGPKSEPQLALVSPPRTPAVDNTPDVAITPSPVTTVEATPRPSLLRRTSFVLAMAVTRGSAVQEFKAPEAVDILDFEIDLDGETRFESFDARLTDGSGREIWRNAKQSPLRPAKDGVLVVSVPVSSGIVSAHSSELEILGRGAGGTISLAKMTISFKP